MRLTELGKTLVDAFRGHWLKIPKLAYAIAGAPVLTWASGFLAKIPYNPFDIPLWPEWLRAFAAFLAISLWVLLDYATRKRIETTPNFDLSFDPTGGGIEPALMDRFRGKMQTECMYIRPTVRATSLTSIKACKAYLNRVEKFPDQGEAKSVLFNGYPLVWTHHLDQAEIDISHGIPQHIDLAYTMKPNWLCLCGGVPNVYRNLLDDPGTYIFHVAVATEALSKHMKVRLRWNGQWDSVTAEMV